MINDRHSALILYLNFDKTILARFLACETGKGVVSYENINVDQINQLCNEGKYNLNTANFN